MRGLSNHSTGVVLASGVFDGLHAGHVAYLEAAKALCAKDELLVCAVAPEAYVLKAKGHPAGWTQAERRLTVCALMAVDATIPQRTLSIAELIREYKPRLLVKGRDWKDRLPDDVWLACAQTGTSVAFVDTPGTSCTEARKRQATDDAALARVEAIVQHQRPADTPWTPVTDYSLEGRRLAEGPHAALIKQAFNPEFVLDCGAGAGHFLTLLAEAGVRGYGMDCTPCADERIYHGDLTDDRPRIEWELPYWGYDLVICREVLEHLTVTQIAKAVRNLCRLSDTFVYVTTRFAKDPRHLLDVDTSDDLDPTHITMLTQPFLRTLFVLEGFRRRTDLEEQLDWMKKGRVLVYERHA